MSNSPLAQRAAKRKRTASGDRWAHLNAFVDSAMKDITTLSELKVWAYLFRNEREGRVETSTRQIASCVGISANSANTALQKLREHGLVELLKASRSHGKASVYRLNPPATVQAGLNGTVQAGLNTTVQAGLSPPYKQACTTT